MNELEEIVIAKTSVFDTNSIDTYSFGVNLVCTSVHFDKAMDSNAYLCMILCANGSEVQIEPEIIEKIYLDTDETTTIEFDNGLLDLEIKYRD